MHYAVLVITEDAPIDDDSISEIMAPYGDSKEWDWYQIGGRWTGLFDENYKPEEDPANTEVCDLCAGTGTRTDMVVENGCNKCHGTGKAVKWPTQWKKYNKDTIPLDQLTAEHLDKFFAVLTDYGWHSSEIYYPWRKEKHFEKLETPTLEWLLQRGNFATVVDCHN